MHASIILTLFTLFLTAVQAETADINTVVKFCTGVAGGGDCSEPPLNIMTCNNIPNPEIRGRAGSSFCVYPNPGNRIRCALYDVDHVPCSDATLWGKHWSRLDDLTPVLRENKIIRQWSCEYCNPYSEEGLCNPPCLDEDNCYKTTIYPSSTALALP